MAAMMPPQRLREELALQRERGRPFRVAWPAALNVALRDEPLTSAVWWRRTFGEQRATWHACYSGPNRKRSLFAAESAAPDRGPLIVA